MSIEILELNPVRWKVYCNFLLQFMLRTQKGVSMFTN